MQHDSRARNVLPSLLRRCKGSDDDADQPIKKVLRFTNKFPSDLPDAIESALKSATSKYAILFFGAAVFHLVGTWVAADRRDERAAEASRAIESAAITSLHFNNRVRLDKPPLTYWRRPRVISFWSE
jgi:hypothetical protein